MTFTERDLRAGLDVYAQDNVYLGTIIRVRWEGGGWRSRPNGADARTSAIQPVVERAGDFSGERLGPVPTSALGNTGPSVQSAAAGYASHGASLSRADQDRPAELLVFRWLVALNWATARPKLRRIPVDLVGVVSLERIILTVPAHQLP